VSARVRTRERHDEVISSHEVEQVEEDGEEYTEEMDQTERERKRERERERKGLKRGHVEVSRRKTTDSRI